MTDCITDPVSAPLPIVVVGNSWVLDVGLILSLLELFSGAEPAFKAIGTFEVKLDAEVLVAFVENAFSVVIVVRFVFCTESDVELSGADVTLSALFLRSIMAIRNKNCFE